MRTLLLAVVASTLAGSALAQTPAPAPAPAPQPVGSAMLKTADGGDAGMVTAYHGPLGVVFKVEGKGWPEGWHGVHLHAVGTCEGPKFTSAGGANGGPDLGDLQNVYAHADGTANAEVYLAAAGLNMQPQDLLDGDGLSFLVHANRDDHVSQPIGGAGDRIACGVFQTSR